MRTYFNRHRVFTDNVPRSAVYTASAVPGWHLDLQVDKQWNVYKEIYDVSGKKRRKDGRYDPTCVTSNSLQLVSNPIWTGNGPSGVINVSNVYQAPLDESWLSSLVPELSEGSLASMAEEAFIAFSTQIPQEVSIANFLYELREISSLIPKMERSLSKTAAGGYLNFSFGWSPFLGDLRTLGNLVGSVQGKIQHLIDTYGKRTRLHRYFPDVVPLPVIRDMQWLQTPVGQFAVYMTHHQTDVRCNGFLFHLLEGLKSFGGQLRAFASALGLNNPLQVFWEAIPYSFVVDWFLKVGRRLSALTAQPFQGEWSVTDTTTTVKSMTRWDVYQGQQLFNGVNFTVHSKVGRVSCERFTRYNYLPLDLATFNVATLSPQQLTLYLALLLK